jgi:hypothetical protein
MSATLKSDSTGGSVTSLNVLSRRDGDAGSNPAVLNTFAGDKRTSEDVRLLSSTRNKFGADRITTLASQGSAPSPFFYTHPVVKILNRNREAKMTPYIVVAISENQNSFGLSSIVLFGPEGRAWRALSSKYNMPFRGQAFAYLPSYWECVTPLPKPPAETYRLAVCAATLVNAFAGSLDEELSNQDFLDAEEAL